MAILKIDGVAVKDPKKCDITISDIDGETTRNAAGLLIRDWIAEKRKVEVEWGPLSTAESAAILSKVKKGKFVELTFEDPELGLITRTMYVGDRKVPMYSCINGVPRWEGLSVNFIER